MRELVEILEECDDLFEVETSDKSILCIIVFDESNRLFFYYHCNF